MFPSPGIGDILAICNLVIKIGTVIWDVTTNEVPKEFQELKEELRVLWEVLQSIKNIDGTSLSLDATLALQRIQREAKSCEDAMNEFLKNNSPPESKTRRAVWMICVTKKANLLREKLSIHRQNLGIFWNEFRHQQQADYNKKQVDHNKKQTDMLNQLLTLAAQHSNGQTDLLSQVLILGREQATNSNGHTEALSQIRGTAGQLREMAIEQAASLESWRKELQVLRPVIQGITLVDAVGSRMEIPFLFCRTYDLLSEVLLAIFKNGERPGRNFVLRGDYNLVHGDAKDLISSSEWTSLLKPDLNVEMSMILRQNGAAVDTCPRCRTSFHGDASDGWATCLKCNGQFQIKQHIREIDEITTPSAVASEQKIVSSSSGQSTHLEESEPEWALFRLLSIVSTIFKPKYQESRRVSPADLQKIGRMFRSQILNQPGSSASSNYGPSKPHPLIAKGSRLAKFFDHPRDDGVSPPSTHSHTRPGAGGMGGMGPGGMMGPRHDLVTPPHQQQFDDPNGRIPDLLALLQGTRLQQNRGGNAPSQHMYPEEIAMLRQREMTALRQQQQIREREQRQLEQQLYESGNENFDSRRSFVANDLMPGLRPPINRPERDLYNSDRLDDRLAYAAHGRVPGVPRGYDQMMRNMGINQPPRGAANIGGASMYSGLNSGQGSMGHLEMLQAQQREQQLREQRQRQLARQQEIERAQMLALQSGGPLPARSTSGNLLAQLGPRQNNIDQFNRGGRFGANDLQAQQLGGYGGNLGGLNGPNAGGIGGGFGGNQLNGFDAPLRQQQISAQQQRQVPGMGFGGIEQRYAQNQLHGAGAGMLNQGGGQPNDLMALLLAGNRGGQQN